MKNELKKKYTYKGYYWSLFFTLLITISMGVYYYISIINQSSKQNWLSVILGIIASLFCSILVGFLTKFSDDKRYDREKEEQVKKLRDFYLTDFKRKIKNFIESYIKSFKAISERYGYFYTIYYEENLNVENLMKNFTLIEELREIISLNQDSPKTKAEWLVNDIQSLLITDPKSIYNLYYKEISDYARKLENLSKIENEKYEFNIFSEDDLFLLSWFSSYRYSIYFAKEKFKDTHKINKFDLQINFQYFEKVNEAIKQFSILIEESRYFTINKEYFEKISKNYDEWYKHYQQVCKGLDKVAQTMKMEFINKSF